MLDLAARVQALRGLYVLTVVAAATYAVWAGQGAAGVVVGGLALLKTRAWVWPWLHARRALARPAVSHAAGPLAIHVPAGWTVEASSPEGVALDAPGAFFKVWSVAARPDLTPARALEAATTALRGRFTFRDERPLRRTFVGLPGEGLAATLTLRLEVSRIVALAARAPDGRLVWAMAYGELSVPEATLLRCLDGVALRAT